MACDPPAEALRTLAARSLRELNAGLYKSRRFHHLAFRPDVSPIICRIKFYLPCLRHLFFTQRASLCSSGYFLNEAHALYPLFLQKIPILTPSAKASPQARANSNLAGSGSPLKISV